jgi:2-C-methyl-D-erythritol 2,4-cyclodiphosphate synthase
MYRVGNGFDVHRFEKDRKLILGGVEIPHESGLIGHSDADVVLHAITDAILGAIGEKDIGTHFPDTDPELKDISSITILRKTGQKLMSKDYEIVNIDTVIICQQPRLAPYIDLMKINISKALGILEDQIGVKATTTEHLGFTGREEGIAATAIVLIKKI